VNIFETLSLYVVKFICGKVEFGASTFSVKLNVPAVVLPKAKLGVVVVVPPPPPIPPVTAPTLFGHTLFGHWVVV